MAQQWVAFLEDLSSIPSTYIRWLTFASSSSSRDQHYFLACECMQTQRHSHLCSCIGAYTYAQLQIKIKFLNKMLILASYLISLDLLISFSSVLWSLNTMQWCITPFFYKFLHNYFPFKHFKYCGLILSWFYLDTMAVLDT